jgi:hypothetical protein
MKWRDIIRGTGSTVRERRGGLVLCLLFLAGCTFPGLTEIGGPSDNPFVRKFTWFSYVAGEDIQKSCRSGAADQFRFIHNAVYGEQVRSYDLMRAEDKSYVLISRVVGNANLQQFSLNLSDPDLFAAWRPKVSTTPILAPELGNLVTQLGADGFFGQAPIGLELPSYGFYWVAVACHRGKYHLNAYSWPSPRYATIEFPNLLAKWNQTGIPMNPPRITTPFQIFGTTDEDEYVNFFHLKFDQHGRL